jgi:replicative DNA helicase
MAKFYSAEVEQKLLSLFCQSPFHLQLLHLDLNLFKLDAHRDLAKMIKKYVKKYKLPPTKDTFKNFIDSKIEDAVDVEDLPKLLELFLDLPKSKKEEFKYYMEKAEQYLIGRDLADLNDAIAETFEEREVDFKNVKKDVIKKLFSTKGGDEVQRGFIYEDVRERGMQYKEMEKGISKDIIKFGMSALDNAVGGMRKTFLTLVYGRTGVGKTRFALNVADNVEKAGKLPMYVTVEMDKMLISSLIDARRGALDSEKIIFGKLDKEERRRYIETLKKIRDEEPKLWIASIPRNASSTKVFEELERYEGINGTFPDLVVIDYANLLEPEQRYVGGRSEKFDNLLKEFHEGARYYKVGILTMMQESRTASTKDIKNGSKKAQDKEEDGGVTNIGLSNFAAIHCETVIRLKQNEKDKLKRQMWGYIDKSRYTKSGDKVCLYTALDINLIGDRELIFPNNKFVKI